MTTGFDRRGPAVVLEAVLHTEQLADVRRMLDERLHGVEDPALWRIVTATNELVTNALVHAGRCLGLRIYLAERLVRIEVDDPSPVRVVWDPTGGGLGIVAGLTTSCGDEVPGLRSDADGPGRRVGGVAKTVWCEIAR